MKKGNVNSAMKILADNMKSGILLLTRQTLNKTTVKTPRRERSISKNIANRYTRNSPSY